ncbi:MAG: PDZ domain-containing protein [Planctomycetes bacterium]|nr:PDZ domain-containing protein [Planctomycetota bacterium]
MKVIALTALVLALAPRADGDGARRAKAYLAEVKKHLTQSYIDRERIDDRTLEQAGLRGLGEAANESDFGELSEEGRAALKDALREKKTLDDAFEAAGRTLEEDKVDWLKLADHAARAMVRATGDPYARILTREDFNKLLKMLMGGQREDSVGLAVQPSDSGFSVAFVQYGYVAYDAGIEIGDEIVAIDGKRLAGRSAEDVNEQLKLKPGEEITLTISRPGHEHAYDFRLVQRRHRAKDVHYAMLGDGVGYLRMTLFDMALTGEVKKALESLKKEGMTSLILDLRHNPGGALPTATAVADVLLPQGLLITKVEMHYKPALFGIPLPGLGGDQEYRTKTRSAFEHLPLRVLVNRASASASELLAGALQDHQRGLLIGETTYGKGVGQSPILLSSTGGGFLPERVLYLTVLRYFLPSGRSIDHKGVVPDVAYAAKKIEPETFAALWEIRTSKAVAEYLDAHWQEEKATFRRLADYDGFKTDAYPDFENLYTGLKTRLSRDEARGELRLAIRRRFKAEEGIHYVHDLQTDVQLQYALVDLLEARK